MRISIAPSTNLAMTMRDMGYTFETAMADIIDNSISAGAKTIQVIVPPGSPLRVAIIDDGGGLTRDELSDALVLAANSPKGHRNQSDLGRFGVGLKTASWSQCRKLTVVTSVNGDKYGATIDLDQIQATGEWSADLLTGKEDVSAVPHANLLGDSGTLVLWEKVDRLEQSTKELTQSFANEKVTGLVRHLELVFHRFLSVEDGYSPIKISVNGGQLKPFDPFMRSHPGHQESPREPIDLGDRGRVWVQGYTLPYKKKWNPRTLARDEKYGDPLKTQGFYLYRERRLIVWGTWFKMIKRSRSLDLARIKIDIPNTMDDLWRINIMKGSAQPPVQVRNRLKRIIGTLQAPARQVYRKRGAMETEEQEFPLWCRVENNDGVSYRISDDHPLVDQVRAELSTEGYKRLDALLQLVAASLPVNFLYSDFGDSVTRVQPPALTDTALESAVRVMWTELRKERSAQEAEVELRQMPFLKTQGDEVLRIVEELKNDG